MNDYRGWKGTKAGLTLLTLLLGTVMLAIDKLTGGEWIMGVVGLVGIYVAGDVTSRFAGPKP